MRYILHPGYVASKNDSDTHYIGVAALISLYKVDPHKCILERDLLGYSPEPDDIHLYPRWNGDYTIKEGKFGNEL